jgi:hypothetical protein
MTNPAPRPALRKAEDSSVHPAAPVRPSRTRSRATAVPAQPTSPVEAPPTGTTAAAADAGSAPRQDKARQDKARQDKGREGKPRPKAAKASKERAFSGATSDHLRPDAVAAAAETAAGKKSKPQPPTKRTKRAWTDVDLMRGKTVELDVQVPKRLRKAARDEAKRRGLDLDAVTTELLHRWLTGR